MITVMLGTDVFDRNGFVKLVSAIDAALAVAGTPRHVVLDPVTEEDPNPAAHPRYIWAIEHERAAWKRVADGIAEGLLKPLDVCTLARLPKGEEGGGVVPLQELVAWGADTGLYDFRRNDGHEVSHGARAQDDSTSRATITTHLLQTRRNILDPAIDKAINNAGGLDSAAVYLALRELALGEESPFTGEIVGNALCYTNSKGEPAKLTKDALAKRLKGRTNKRH